MSLLFDRRKSIAYSEAAVNMQVANLAVIAQNSWPGTKIAILTAGDDTQGMNAAVRAATRTGMYLGCQVVYIKHGFKGMVEGGSNFEEATWYSTSDIIGVGGTILKSYKCPEFLDRSGRLKAAKNLVERGINNIVAIGGDGTLKGIRSLHSEWDSLLHDLESKNLVDKNLIQKCRSLKVVCILASITNDVCNTDLTIGVNSALHRIIEAIDAMSTTSSSSQLAFVVQVMGQTSGYLALATGLMYDASMIFIPEWPSVGDWRDELCDKVKDDIRLGSEGIICIICEGAIDRNGKPITPEEVKDTLVVRLNLNAKITVLGHVQRGGSPTAYDRIIATKMGVEAVSALKDIPAEAGPSIIGFSGNSVVCLALVDVLESTKKVEEYLHEKKFFEVVRLRGKNFMSLLGTYNLRHSLRSSAMPCVDIPGVTKVAVVRLGKSTINQCMVMRAIVGFCHSKNIIVLAFANGFPGVINREVHTLCWETVKKWTHRQIVLLDTSNVTIATAGIEKVAAAFEEMRVSGLFLIGNFKAYKCLVEIHETKNKYRSLCIPTCVLPVTLVNNIPGVETSIGSDSALNEIIIYCDKLRRVARGQTNRVFVIETMGQNCGYLATISGLCVGAEAAYIKQERFTLDTLLADAAHLRNQILNSEVKMGLIMVSDQASSIYNTDFIHKLFSEEGKGVYTCRASTIGQIQLGGLPSAFDRIMAAISGVRAGEWMYKSIENNTDQFGNVYTIKPEARCVLSYIRHTATFTPISQLVYETDFDENMPTYLPWMKLRPMIRILTKHEETLEIDLGPDSFVGGDTELLNQFKTEDILLP